MNAFLQKGLKLIMRSIVKEIDIEKNENEKKSDF